MLTYRSNKEHLSSLVLISFTQSKAEIDKFKSEAVEMDSQRKTILKHMEEQLATATEQADNFDAQSKQSKKIIEQLKSGKKKKPSL